MGERTAKLPDLLAAMKLKNQVLSHAINNSFRRNLMTPASQAYQVKLMGLALKKHDTRLLVRHLYSKQSLSKDDRNLLRRILLTVFDEEMLQAAGNNFLNKLTYHQYKAFQQIIPNKKCLYLMLLGDVRITTQNFVYRATGPQLFGHRQHMAASKITLMQFKNDTVLLQLSEEDLNKPLHRWMANSAQKLSANVGPLSQILLNILDTERRLAFFAGLQPQQISAGDRLTAKWQPITHLFFVGHAQLTAINDPINSRMRCLGLGQLCRNQLLHQQNVSCISATASVHAIDISNFKHILGLSFAILIKQIQPIFLSNQLINDFQHYFNLSQKKVSINSFMQHKPVYLSLQKKKRTYTGESEESVSTQRQAFAANFVFLKSRKQDIKNKVSLQRSIKKRKTDAETILGKSSINFQTQ